MRRFTLQLCKLVILPISTLCLISQSAAAECNQTEAYNKMLALNKAQARIAAASPQSVDSAGTKLAMESAGIGQLLADQKFDEACKQYEMLAIKYGIDLKKEAKGMVTFEELAKDGGARGGECGVAEASKKMMGLHEQLQDKVALGEVSSDVFRDFGKDTEKYGELMMTNPSEVCRQLEGLKTKYKLK